MEWQDVTYDIALPKSRRAAKRMAKADKERATYNERAAASPDHLCTLPAGHRRILNGLGGSVNRGEMVAVLGASGAGKTTLLNVLSARLGKQGSLNGSVLYEGRPRDPATWKRVVGYVEQDDINIPCLSVRETLEYAARLRLPDMLFTREQKQQRVEDTIAMLRLEKCQDTRMGNSDAADRGVSGGERKRTAIGSELVSDVSLLLLDEPTSGLDAFAAWSVVDNLRDVSRQRNVACLMTIHQPSWRMFQLFDCVILLARGTTFFQGRPEEAIPWFKSLGYTHPDGTNPADYFIDISQNLEKTDEAEEHIGELLAAWRNRTPAAPLDVAEKHSGIGGHDDAAAAASRDDTMMTTLQQTVAYKTWPSGYWMEFAILAERAFFETIRNPVLLLGALGQTVVLLIVIGFAFFRLGTGQSDVLARIGILFFLPVNSAFAVLFPIINVFPLGRRIMRRERYAGLYRTSSFYLSRMMVELPSQVIQRFLFYVILYWMIGLQANAGKFFIYLAVNNLLILVMIGLGFCIGAISPTVEIASIIAPGFTVIFLLFGGNLLPSPPPWFVWLRWISPITYGYLALAQNELQGLTFTCNGVNTDGAAQQCYRTGSEVMQQYNLQNFTIAESVGFLFALFAVFAALGYVLLRFTAHPRFRFTAR